MYFQSMSLFSRPNEFAINIKLKKSAAFYGNFKCNNVLLIFSAEYFRDMQDLVFDHFNIQVRHFVQSIFT